MGGYGSGWQGATKATVEGSVVLTAASLVRKRALVAGAWTSGSLGWISDGEDKPHATIGYEADLSDQANAWLRLRYRRNGEPVDYRVRLVTSTPHYGGLRWWSTFRSRTRRPKWLCLAKTGPFQAKPWEMKSAIKRRRKTVAYHCFAMGPREYKPL